MGKGRKGQGNGFRPVIIEREKEPPSCGGKLAAATRRADGSRVCSCSGSFCLSQELAEQRVVERVSPSPCTDQESLAGEPCEVFPLEFASEVVGCKLTLPHDGELMDEIEFLGAQL